MRLTVAAIAARAGGCAIVSFQCNLEWDVKYPRDTNFKQLQNKVASRQPYNPASLRNEQKGGIFQFA